MSLLYIVLGASLLGNIILLLTVGAYGWRMAEIGQELAFLKDSKIIGPEDENEDND